MYCLLENVHPVAIELLKSEGFNVETYHAAMTEDELCEKIKNVSVLGIRSKTQVTAKVLEQCQSPDGYRCILYRNQSDRSKDSH